jgi:class 3 adenylate cyclase
VKEGRASGTVTVLFTDLVGSTALMAGLGAEAFDRIRQAHFAALRQAIDRHGGEEIKNTGDGLMATFASVADAVRCAVAMQQATHRQARRAGVVPVAIRVGLSVGDVTFEDGDVFGAPVVEAARLVAAAGPDEILTTQVAGP